MWGDHNVIHTNKSSPTWTEPKGLKLSKNPYLYLNLGSYTLIKVIKWILYVSAMLCICLDKAIE
jgi:hypothetical protein